MNKINTSQKDIEFYKEIDNLSIHLKHHKMDTKIFQVQAQSAADQKKEVKITFLNGEKKRGEITTDKKDFLIDGERIDPSMVRCIQRLN